MNPRRYWRAVLAVAMFSVLEAKAQEPLTTRCESAPLTAAFAVFSEAGRMPPDLGRFIADAALQKIDPYKAFDNVYYVGICWVSAWLLTSPHGTRADRHTLRSLQRQAARQHPSARFRPKGHQARRNYAWPL